MKVFLSTDVLVDAAKSGDENSVSRKLISALIGGSEFSIWVSAVTVYDVEWIIREELGKDNAYALLHLIKNNFSMVPFRQSVFNKAIEQGGGDFGVQTQIASAEALHMDRLIAVDVDQFEGCGVPVITPEGFLEEIHSDGFGAVTSVPFMDLKAQHHQIYNEIDDRYTDIIANRGFILGKYVAEFEEKFAEIQGAKYCVGVSSGTDALHVALMALGIGHGDGVIVPVHTFIATSEAVSLCGAVPVFCDCDEFYNIDVKGIEKILEENAGDGGVNIKAIIPVHLYGQPVKMAEVMALAKKYDVKVVEDACQSHLAEYDGKRVGNLGEFGAFSFYPGKNLGGFGEGGALITNDEELFKKAKMIRQHGEVERYHHGVVGHNYRMSALQGAALGVKLKYIEEWTEKRRKNAALYNELLGGVEGIEVPGEIDGVRCVYHLYVIQFDDRDGLMGYLGECGVTCGLHYPVPLHLQEAYKDLGYGVGDFPVAERAAGRILSLPMFPELTERQIRYVCDKVKEFILKA